LHFSQTKQEG